MADPDPGEMLPEYDFTKLKGVVRGKYASRESSQPRTVRLADDLALVFPNDKAVNAALRDYLSGHTIGPESGQPSVARADWKWLGGESVGMPPE